MEEEKYNISVETYNEDIRHNYLNDYLVMLKELFDNSLDWGNATKIKIRYSNNSLYIIDNGNGINVERFRTILKHGEKNIRRTVNTIGKHGRGLNYASVLLSNRTIVHTIRQDRTTNTQCVDWNNMIERNIFKPEFNYNLTNTDKRFLYKGETGTMIKLEDLTEKFKKKMNEKKFRNELVLNIKRLYYFSYNLNKKITFEIQFNGDRDIIITEDDFKDVLCYDSINETKLISFENIRTHKILPVAFYEENLFPLKLYHSFSYNKGMIVIKATFLSEKKLLQDKIDNNNKTKNYNGIYVQRISYKEDDSYITRDMVGPNPTEIFGFREGINKKEDRLKRLRIAIQFTANLDKEFGITILKKFDASREDNIEEKLHKMLTKKIKSIIDFQSHALKIYRTKILKKKLELFNKEMNKKNSINKEVVTKLQEEIRLLGEILYNNNSKREIRKDNSNKKSQSEYQFVNNINLLEVFKKQEIQQQKNHIKKVNKIYEHIIKSLIEKIDKVIEKNEKVRKDDIFKQKQKKLKRERKRLERLKKIEDAKKKKKQEEQERLKKIEDAKKKKKQEEQESTVKHMNEIVDNLVGKIINESKAELEKEQINKPLQELLPQKPFDINKYNWNKYKKYIDYHFNDITNIKGLFKFIETNIIKSDT